MAITRRIGAGGAALVLALVAAAMGVACGRGSSAGDRNKRGAEAQAMSHVDAATLGPTQLLPYPAGATGYAISWPQCGASLPSAPFDFGIVGVTNGRAFKRNPCVGAEYSWARTGRRYAAFYMNTNFDASAYPDVASKLREACGDRGRGCEAYLYGQAAANTAFSEASDAGATAEMWWLDVQIVSSWSEDVGLNALAIRGVIDQLHAHDVRVGISSTPFQWHQIAGDYAPGLPAWVAGASDASEAALFCDGRQDFGGGRTEQIAYVRGGLEMVRACGEPVARSRGRSDRGRGD